MHNLYRRPLSIKASFYVKLSAGPVPVRGVPANHAQAVERWLRYHLEQVGKTQEQLAVVLWEKN
jgi:tRNA splicing ligase